MNNDIRPSRKVAVRSRHIFMRPPLETRWSTCCMHNQFHCPRYAFYPVFHFLALIQCSNNSKHVYVLNRYYHFIHFNTRYIGISIVLCTADVKFFCTFCLFSFRLCFLCYRILLCFYAYRISNCRWPAWWLVPLWQPPYHICSLFYFICPFVVGQINSLFVSLCLSVFQRSCHPYEAAAEYAAGNQLIL